MFLPSMIVLGALLSGTVTGWIVDSRRARAKLTAENRAVSAKGAREHARDIEMWEAELVA